MKIPIRSANASVEVVFYSLSWKGVPVIDPGDSVYLIVVSEHFYDCYDDQSYI